jgi:hypothetical protein
MSSSFEDGYLPSVARLYRHGNAVTQPQDRWIVANVMLVQWSEGNTVARRLGVGKIIITAWQRALPQLKDVILE